MNGERCSFCGRHADDCPGGLWRLGRGGWPAICIYCARTSIRAFGELPDTRPAEPVPIFSRRQIAPGSAA